MDGVKKVTSRTTTNHASSLDHRRIQKSSTLNRKFVKRPTARPKITAAAGAASRSLRQHGQARALIQKQNTVRLAPSSKITQNQQQQQQQRQAQAQTERISVRQTGTAKQQQQAKQVAAAQQQQRGQVAVKKQTQAQQVKQAQQQQQQRAVRRQIVSAASKDLPVQKNQTLEAARARMAARKQAAQPQHLSAQELKERAIQQALRKVDKIDGDKTMAAQFVDAGQQKTGHFWQRRGFAIAAGMAVISLALLGYLVHLNLPDISVRVTAMQTGIEKIYPSYVPTNYRLDGLVKEDAGRVTMNFKNDEDKKFTLMEEKSNWDSAAVLSKYVKKNWGNDYSIAKGQGLTIYVSGANAAWVNGGVFYVITDEGGNLSASDLHDIAVSL
ncbi:MAG: DUF4367 domain-containing protein [Candidatus Saccharibacteria bacterium]|nr:DUF4367 domain-containing protein [Candidatus Saccharibacteria bacterium]